MRKITVPAIFLALLFATATVSSVVAEDSSGSARVTRTEARQEIKDLRQDNREFIASREAEFKANLQKIRDTRKQTIVSNINDRISNRNTTWVTHWNVVTKRLSTILDKIQSRSDEAASKGKDVSSVTTAISAARSAIASAQAAIDAQSAKTYTITITSEDTLGTSVRSTISTFQADVKSVITLLNTARKAVESAFTALRTVVGTEPAATTAPTTQP